MTIYRGPGGTGSASSDADTTQFQEFLVQTQAARDAAQTAQVAAEAAEANAEAAAGNVDAGVAASAASATAAAGSATSAATSATNASSSASSASTSATNAASSASSASTSASSASTSATNAGNSATAAATSATAASTSASAAASSASTATTQASNAAGSASSASTSASTATTQASNAASSASAASSSATAATSSATSAASSATAAASSATAAAASAASINDAALVHKTGNETIGGVKTFTSSIAGSVTGTAANVTGTVAVSNGGTGSTTAAEALTNLGALASTNPSYTGTLTGGTGVINIGSNQFYKDANGNIGLGMAPSGWGVGFKAIQGSADLSLAAQDITRIATNCYYTGTVWKFTSTGYAALFETNKTNGALNYSVSTATGTAGGTTSFSTRFFVDGTRANIAGALRVNSLAAPEGDIDFTVQSDVRWLGRAGRLDCVNNANTAWQSGVFRGANLFFRTADDTTRFAVYNNGRAYLEGNSASRGGNGYILSVRDDSLAEPLRAAGYIEWLTNVGAIGTYYFNSDARLKKNISPTVKTARQAVDQIEFKQFDWNEFTDQNNEHVELGVIAQQLQQVNPKFVNKMTDSTLGVNEPELLTYALKAIQEISAELAAVKQQLVQMKGTA